MRVAPVLLVLCLAASCSAQTPAIPNASFEVDDDADGIPDGWRLEGASAATSVALEDGAPGYGHCVRLTSEDSATRMFLEAPRVPVKPGGVYVFEARVKSEDVTAGFPTVGIARWKADGTWDDWSQPLRVPVNRDWQLYRQAFTMPQSTSQVAVRVWVERFRGTAWFDEVKVARYSAAEPLASIALDDPRSWEVTGGEPVAADGGLQLQSSMQRDERTLFPVARMRHALPAEAGRSALRVEIGAVKGLWAVKVRDRGYVQEATESTGVHYCDLKGLAGTRGGPPAYVEIQALGDLAQVTVKQVALVEEVPPSVADDATYSDRYVAAAQDVGPLELPQKHPYIALSENEIARVKTRGREYARWLEGIVSSADAHCAAPTVVPEQGDVYSMDYFCPDHGVPLQWRADFPHEHLCPAGGETLTGAKLDQEWRINRDINAHRANRSALRTLGYAYVFTSEEKYAQKAREILLEYADKFPNYLWHSGRGQLVARGGGMRAAYEPLGEAAWLADMVQGYDLVAASAGFADDERRAIEGMLRDDVQVSLRYDEGLSNRQCHHNLAVGATGLCLRDETLVRRTVGSFRYQMKYGVLGDGLWWECSPGYGSYAMNTVLELVQMLGRAGVDLTREPKLKLAFDAPLAFLFPDQTAPGVNDSHWRSGVSWDRYEYLYGIYRDPRYATILSDKNRTGMLCHLLYGRELGPQEPLPVESHLFSQAGMAMLKPGADEDALAVCFDWGQTVAGHGHADKLNIVLYGKGGLLGPDNGSRSYFSPVWRFWDRQTLSHNTVVVNERSQEHRKGRLEVFSPCPGLTVCQATADDTYTGLRQRRTLFATCGYLVDMFRVARDSTDLALRDDPVSCIPGWRREPWGDSTPESLARDSALLQRTEDAHSGRFAALVGHTEHVSAAWATAPRITTGQNQALYHADTPVDPGVTYRFAFWARCLGASGDNTVVLSWQNEEARVLERVVVPVPTDASDWTEYSREVTAPAAADRVALRIGSVGNRGVLIVDDISLCPAGASGDNTLTLNADFEAVDLPVETIDWSYRNLGRLDCPVASAPMDVVMGRPGDDPYWDGENGYRYMKDLRTGETDGGNWQANWATDEATGLGLSLTMLGEPGTQVVTADGQGPGTMRVPLVIARRTQADTVFGAVLEPVRGDALVRGVTLIPCTAAGAQVGAVEGYGVSVRLPDRTDSYLASYTDTEKHFGPMVLKPHGGEPNCLAAVSVTAQAGATPGAGEVLTAYVQGGKLSFGPWSLAALPAYRGHVLSCDDEAKTVTVDCPLPPGRALSGAVLTLDLPYNVALTVATVEPAAEGSLIRLRDLPNLALPPAAPFSIPTAAFLSLRAQDVYRVQATAGAEVGMPVAEATRRVEAGSVEGGLRPRDVARTPDGLWLRLAAADVPAGEAFIVFNRPAGKGLEDATPPRITAVEVDGNDVVAAPYVELPHPPRSLVITLHDETSGVVPEPVELLVNGRPADGDAGVTARICSSDGTVRVELDGRDATAIESVRLVMRDDSLLRNRVDFTLRVVRAVESIALPGADGGKAVALIGEQAQLQASLRLAAGDYVLDLIGYGPDLATNSLWLEVDGERVEDVVHLPVGELGSCSRDVDITPALPRFHLAESGEHTLRLTVREAPGAVVAKVRVLRDGQVVEERRGEEMVW